MKQLALVALDDGDVDILSAIRRRDDLALAAVYHSDPAALIVRLAAMAGVPVVTDPAGLFALPVDVWIGGGQAAAVHEAAGDHARTSGRTAPLCIPVSEIEAFMADPDGYGILEPAQVARDEIVTAAAAAGAAHAVASGSAISIAPAAAGSEQERHDSHPSDALDENTPDTKGEEPTTVIRKDAPAAKSDAHHTTAPHSDGHKDREAAVAEAESRTGDTDADESQSELDASYSIGNPSMEMLYDPGRLGAWLADAACRVAGGSAAVLWRRESDGKRYTLVSFAPGADALPTIPFPATQLEEYVRAGRVQAVSPDHFVTPDTAPLPFRFLAVPLPGEKQPFGLLGVFRPVVAGDFPSGALSELSARAAELGVAVERCFQYARMGLELRGLRYKERVRDLLLEPGLSENDLWSRLLRFLLDEVPADFAQFYGLTDEGRRLSLSAVVSRDEEFEGLVSIPVGRGLIGSALARERLSVYTADDNDPRGLYLLPVRARRSEGLTAVGVIVMDGAPDRSTDGQDTAGLLEMTGSIIAPLLSSLLSPARA